MLTSICGFAALLPSAFPGLAQLGLYSIAGLVTAALVTRFVLPHWSVRVQSVRDLTAVGEAAARVLRRLRPLRWALMPLALLAVLALYVQRDGLFSHELASLNPVSRSAQRLDDELRADLGAPDVRYVLVTRNLDRAAALTQAQQLSVRLGALLAAGVIGGFESPTRYLPPPQVQKARQDSLPDAAELRATLREAIAGLPVRAAVLEPFVADVDQARHAPLLTEADLAGTSFAAAEDALLVREADGWAALLPVDLGAGNLPPDALARLRGVAAEGGAPATLLDLKGEADRLYTGYLSAALALALAGFGAIVLLLLVALRSPARVARVVLPLALAVLSVAGAFAAARRPLTILHVVGMLLIVAVGSNYALFFDRSSERPHEGSVPRTLASLLVANAATVATFGVLASSRVALLADLGSTVAPGTLLALLFAALLALPGRQPDAARG
jgi:predicted exporter